MRRLIICILAFALASLPCVALAEDVLVLMSLRSKGYREAVDAALHACPDASRREVHISESPEVDVARLVRETRAKVVLAVGDGAFRMATAFLSRTPIVGLLTLEDQAGTHNVRTVSYLAQPEQYLAQMKQMGRRRVGVVYSGIMAPYIRKADRLSKKYGVSLEKREVQGPQDVLGALSSLEGHVDALWVLPDSDVITPMTVEALFRFSSAAGVPTFAFAANYLSLGAAVALEPERAAMGRQAGVFVCEALGDEPADAAADSIRLFSVVKNPGVINKLSR